MFRSNALPRLRLSLALVSCLILMAQTPASAATGSVAGAICDQATGQPLHYANVVLLGTTIGSNVGKSGQFRIDNVPAGMYKIQVSYVGYNPVTREVVVRPGKVTQVSFCKDEDAVAGMTLGSIADPTTGELWAVGSSKGRLPLRDTDVAVSISGSMAKVVVEQTFENLHTQAIEAIYVFPLPHEAAVHAMSIRIGERRLEAQIRKRQEANEIYEAAREDGRTAALLEQERPNIFTQHVANLMPGNDVVVRIEYAEQLVYDDGRYELVVPTVVGPRFTPGTPSGAIIVTSSTSQPVMLGTHAVADASRITPPSLRHGEDGGHRLHIRVDLDAGIPLANVRSVNHSVELQRPGSAQAIVSTRPVDTIPNKDFVLRYWPQTGRAAVGVLAHRGEGDKYGYFTLLMQPPDPSESADIAPRELLLVLDVSGSMKGAPIETMKGVVRWMLRRLEPRDSFNIVTFSSTTHVYAPGSLVASAESVQKALRFVEALQGGGGTHMSMGVGAAFSLPSEGSQRRTICLLTDGLIGNDRELLQIVRSRIGNDRLFSMGIGCSPNRYLVDGLAEEGVGAEDFVSLDEDPREAVDRFFRRLDSPVLHDLSINWGNLQVEDSQPTRLPDLFRGQVLRVTGRYRQPGAGQVVIRGTRGSEPFEQSLRVVLPHQAESHASLRHLWARTRIHELERLQRAGNESAAEAIESLGLRFAMMTDYTAFVVADNQVVNKKGAPQLLQQPIEVPQGVTHGMTLGSAGNGLSRGVAGRVQTITVTSVAQKIDVRSSSVSHVATESNPLPMLPVEGVAEAVALNAGVVKQGDDLHVRGCRSGEISLRLDSRYRLHVVIDLVEATINRGKTIQLRIRLKNDSGQEILLPDEYRLQDGTLLLQVKYGEEDIVGPQVVVSAVKWAQAMQPGDDREYLVTLNAADGFTFDRSGRYEIVVVKLSRVWVPQAQRTHYLNLR